MPASIPLNPTEADLWDFVDAFDVAHFDGVHLRDRDAWLDGFELISALVEKKDGGRRFLWLLVREVSFTFVPSAIAIAFPDGPWQVIVGTVLGFGGAIVSFRNIARELRERAGRKLLLEAINRRVLTL